MINIVMYQPEIPANTGNIMRTVAGTNTKLHLIKPLGFSLEDKYVKRCGANYIDNCDYVVYDSYEDFKNKNKGTYYFLTRYGNKKYTDFDYSNIDENIYFIFGRESSGIPLDILKDNFEHCLRIPTSDKIRALNVSNSVAIMLFEALRQQEFNDLLDHDVFKGKNHILEDDK